MDADDGGDGKGKRYTTIRRDRKTVEDQGMVLYLKENF